MKRVLFGFVPLALFVVMVGVAGAAGTQAANKTMKASGKVTAVTADSLSVMDGTDTKTFAFDPRTRVVGKGLGTKSKEKNGKLTVSDAVAVDDEVQVAYHDMNGKLMAFEVRVQKGAKKS